MEMMVLSFGGMCYVEMHNNISTRGRVGNIDRNFHKRFAEAGKLPLHLLSIYKNALRKPGDFRCKGLWFCCYDIDIVDDECVGERADVEFMFGVSGISKR